MHERGHPRQQPVKRQMVGDQDRSGQGIGQGIGKAGDEQCPPPKRRGRLKGARKEGFRLRHARAGGERQRRRPGAQKRLHGVG